jgi:hypothetical protein
MPFKQWEKMDHDRTARFIQEGKTTPYDLAVGRLCIGLALYEGNDFFLGCYVAAGIEKHPELYSKGIRRLVREAPTNPEAMKICATAISALSQQGKPVPVDLGELARDVMRGKIKIGAQRGRPKTGVRDTHIVGTIHELSYWFPKMHITRNEATEEESICAVVARALKDPRLSEFSLELSEKSIERAWSQKDKHRLF